jgi:hypothetical protein
VAVQPECGIISCHFPWINVELLIFICDPWSKQVEDNSLLVVLEQIE